VLKKLVVAAALVGAVALGAPLIGRGGTAAAQTSSAAVIDKIDFTAGEAVVATFDRCIGLGWKATVNTGPDGFSFAKTEPEPLVCERHDDANFALDSWAKQVKDEGLQAAFRSGSLTIYDSTGAAIYRFALENAYPQQLVHVQDRATNTLKTVVTLNMSKVERVP
jgi:hypothetical protein